MLLQMIFLLLPFLTGISAIPLASRGSGDGPVTPWEPFVPLVPATANDNNTVGDGPVAPYPWVPLTPATTNDNITVGDGPVAPYPWVPLTPATTNDNITVGDGPVAPYPWVPLTPADETTNSTNDMLTSSSPSSSSYSSSLPGPSNRRTIMTITSGLSIHPPLNRTDKNNIIRLLDHMLSVTRGRTISATAPFEEVIPVSGSGMDIRFRPLGGRLVRSGPITHAEAINAMEELKVVVRKWRGLFELKFEVKVKESDVVSVAGHGVTHVLAEGSIGRARSADA